jgi:glycosyltransferase involved in cell wall biosynthesis
MRVLVVHNSYRSDSPSGEERVVADDLALLAAAGVEISTYSRQSDEIAQMSLGQRLALTTRPVHSAQAVADVRGIIARDQPDLLHLHNPYPLISPSVISAASDLGVPVVQTVHNYRHVCVAGSYFRDHQICTDCVGKRVAWPAVVHGCYRGSRPQSAIMATTLAVHPKTWRRVARFLPVTAFMADHLLRMGIPAEQVTVKPNSAADPGPPAPLGRSLLYVGRLAEEKGVRELLAAWRQGRHPAFDHLTIAGDGPLRAEVEAAAAHADVTYRGVVSPSVVAELMAEAGAVVVPSLWFEGFPVTIVEAFSHGRPVLATDIGSLSSIVDDGVGWKFAAGELAEAIAAIEPDAPAERGANARRRYEDNFSPPAVTSALLDIYADVLSRRPAA